MKKASVTYLPFRSNYFDIITCVDVIYHKRVKSDKKALSELFRVLKPSGILVIRVPAHNWLRRSCDLQVHTRERYSVPTLKKKLGQVGFRVKKISYVNMFLFLPAFLSFVVEKMARSKAHSSPLMRLPKVLNSFVAYLLSTELPFINTVGLPFGVGVVAVCRKHQ